MLTVLKTALEVGLIYGLVALALFISFSILNIADLSTDGCFTLGCAVGAMLTIAGHPLLALPAAMAAGMLSGFITAFLQTRLGVESILAGIISNTGLYTINLAVMGFSSNVSITGRDTVFSLFKALTGGSQWSTLVLLALLLGVIAVVLIRFFGTSLGLSIRATGDSLDMVSASSINPKATITIGLLPSLLSKKRSINGSSRACLQTSNTRSKRVSPVTVTFVIPNSFKSFIERSS